MGRGQINEGIGSNVEALPDGGTIRLLNDWHWIHAPRHFSLFRERDRTLIADDFFVNVQQESLYKVIKQEREINGPPRYLATDWEAMKQSIE